MPMQLIARHNVVGGESLIGDNDGNILERFTLTEPLDTLIVWDEFVMHGATSIKPARVE